MRIECGKNQRPRCPLSYLLGYDEKVIAGPCSGGDAEVVAEFAGPAGGQFIEPERAEGAHEVGSGAATVDTADGVAAVGGNEFAGLGKDHKLGGRCCDGAHA